MDSILNKNDVLFKHIDCANCKNWKSFIKNFEEEFCFPTKGDLIDGLYDWMEDLSWLGNKEIYILVLSNYDQMLVEDIKAREKIDLFFKVDLIKWWEKDCAKYVVNGKCKTFLIYKI